MKTLAFPKDANPYQELLYSPFRENGYPVAYIDGPTRSASINILTIIPQLILRRLAGYRIWHLHWLYGFIPGHHIRRHRFVMRLLYANYIASLKVAKMLGYKVVWTAHNILPHEPIFINDVAARRVLVRYADITIGHSAGTLKGLMAINAKPKRFIVVPHGSYVDVYPNTITRQEARSRLGINEADFVFGYVGQVRAYKGVQDLLDAHSKIKGTKLVIAGECRESTLRKQLKTHSKYILWSDKHVADADLQLYFAAADVVVLPFRAVTTSGSAILALSFGRPIIIPELGDLVSLPENVKISYKADDPTGLAKAMDYARNHPDELKTRGENALIYAELLSWDRVAQRTVNIFSEL